MINSIKQALTTRDIRRKLEIIVGIIFLTRVISMIPVPGVDASVFKQWMASNSNDALNLFSAFTGGSFENFSMFALGITPLITAQIVIQLMAGVIPSLAKLQKKGEHGQKVTKFITNIVGIVLAAIQSLCMAIGFNKSGMITGNAVFSAIAITVFMTAGTGIMMYLAHIITEKAIGNGVSVLLMANIVSRMPGQFASMAKSVVDGKSKMVAALSITGFIALLLLMIIVIIYMTEGYHPLHVQYSQKMSQSGEDAETGQIPVKVGISGVMPIIFASSLIYQCLHPVSGERSIPERDRSNGCICACNARGIKDSRKDA